MKQTRILFLYFLLITLIACKQGETSPDSFPVLTGPYLGQAPPDTVPELFAPGIVGTGLFTRDVAISPDGKEILYCVAVGNYTYSTILYTKQVDGRWMRPEPVPWAADAKTFDFEPAFSHDGSRLYFLSSRPDGEEEPGDEDIWYVERKGGGWGEPVNPGPPLNTDGGEFFPSPTGDGYLYFTHNDAGSGLNRIFRCKVENDVFSEPELLPDQVNCGTNRFNAFVSPDHTFVIVPAIGMPDSYDGADYYICFRDENDRWSEPINLGADINRNNPRGWSPYISPDRKYFFFMSNRSEEIPASELSFDRLMNAHNSPGNGNSDIYWMKADFIQKLKKQAVYP